MNTFTLPAGTVVHFNGLPFELSKDTLIAGANRPDGTSGTSPDDGGVDLSEASCRSLDECAKPAPGAHKAVSSVAAYLRQTLKTNSRDLDDWREDVDRAACLLEASAVALEPLARRIAQEEVK